MLASMAGLWSSNVWSEEEESVALVLTQNGFHHLLEFPQGVVMEQYPFQPPHHWTSHVQLLRAHVLDLDEVRFVPKQDQRPQPLLQLLGELSGRTVAEYRQDLVDWLMEHNHYGLLLDWLSWKEQQLLDLLQELCSNNEPTGLEVLIAINALQFHINIIQ